MKPIIVAAPTLLDAAGEIARHVDLIFEPAPRPLSEGDGRR